MSEKNPLLLDSQPLVIIPELAIMLGLNEAIVIQQINYWITINKQASRNFHDGRYWTYNTYDEWQKQFPFWSVNTIKSTMKKLEDKGYIITGNYNKFAADRTKWYTINFDALNAKIAKCKNCTTIVQKLYNGKCKNCTSNTIEYTYNSSEINNYMVQNSDEIQNHPFDFKILNKQINKYYKELIKENGTLPYDLMGYIEIFEYFYKCYEEYTGNTHPKIKNDHIKKVMSDLPYIVVDNVDEEVDVEDNKALIDAYFEQPWEEAINPTILHFMSENIRLNRYYEVFR
nr:hypothetical protein [Sedimentibacter sp.]